MRAMMALVVWLVARSAWGQFIELPWLGTNYSRTNLTVWWADGTNYDGVSPWRLSQAVNENFRRAETNFAARPWGGTNYVLLSDLATGNPMQVSVSNGVLVVAAWSPPEPEPEPGGEGLLDAAGNTMLDAAGNTMIP